LGEALFNDFVAEYIRDKPPESYTLHDLGRRFPGWLDETRPDRDAAPEQREIWADFIIDLAQYERQVFVMFDAEGHEGKPFADADTPDRLLRLQPCFALGAYRFPVAVYYHDVRLSRSPTPPARAPSFVALARTDYLTHTIPLREPHHVFLSAVASTMGLARWPRIWRFPPRRRGDPGGRRRGSAAAGSRRGSLSRPMAWETRDGMTPGRPDGRHNDVGLA
jgi:hypothetical protein